MTSENQGPSLRPEITYAQINGRSETIINPSAVLELARSEDNPKTRRFPGFYHDAEARLAANEPSLPEHEIRARAVLAAFQSLGARLTLLAP